VKFESDLMEITLPEFSYKLLFDWFTVYSRYTLLKSESIIQTSVASNEKCKDDYEILRYGRK